MGGWTKIKSYPSRSVLFKRNITSKLLEKYGHFLLKKYVYYCILKTQYKTICFLDCSTTPIVLILHLIKGIPISLDGCQASVCSGRQKSICGYPPSVARRQENRNRHSGDILFVSFQPGYAGFFVVYRFDQI